MCRRWADVQTEFISRHWEADLKEVPQLHEALAALHLDALLQPRAHLVVALDDLLRPQHKATSQTSLMLARCCPTCKLHGMDGAATCFTPQQSQASKCSATRRHGM